MRTVDFDSCDSEPRPKSAQAQNCINRTKQVIYRLNSQATNILVVMYQFFSVCLCVVSAAGTRSLCNVNLSPDL